MELLASLHFLMAHSAFLQILNQTPRSLPDTTGNWKLQTSILSLTLTAAQLPSSCSQGACGRLGYAWNADTWLKRAISSLFFLLYGKWENP